MGPLVEAASPAAGEHPPDAACVRVAVPLPRLPALAYKVPATLQPLAVPGVRVRIRVGPRRLVGVILEAGVSAPPGVELRSVEEVLDRLPVLDPEARELAGFIADYYLAGIGEVLPAMLPAGLRPWGDQRVWLTDAGALAPDPAGAEGLLLAALRSGERRSVASLAEELGATLVARALPALQASGLVTGHPAHRRGSRYRSAVALPPGDPADHRRGAGRSRSAIAVIDYLEAAGRPATVAEVCRAVGCTAAVPRRLIRLGVLLAFTQIERLALPDHELAAPRTPIPLHLRPDQETAVQAIDAALAAGKAHSFLLAGQTGAGKTEVYLRSAARTLEQGRGVLILVPEIALVPALARELRARFPAATSILHSGLGNAEREQEWERLRQGRARILLGPRSAVLAPLASLGLVIVDEEQDEAYKQDTVPRYHARDVALVRARAADAVTVLVSATPSLESRRNVERGRYTQLVLTRRAGSAGPPRVEVVDLRGMAPRRPGEAPISPTLVTALRETVERGDQAIVLRNRRGWAPLLLCRACGEDHRCPDCGLPRTLHRRRARLLCHFCGGSTPVPVRCARCGEEALDAVGTGTERVEEELAQLLPGVAIATLDRDHVQEQGSAAPLVQDFERGTVQVLVGTQMVAKGHHFPGVALAAVLLADTYLGFPDFRAVERTYTLLTQLAGRAGRGERPGRVLLQTYLPDHYAIRAVVTSDDAAFAHQEMEFRRSFHYPPYTRMLQVLSRDRRRATAEERLQQWCERLLAHPEAAEVRIAGPAPAAFERLRGQWRFQLLLRHPSGQRLRRIVRDLAVGASDAGLVFDMDPHQLL